MNLSNSSLSSTSCFWLDDGKDYSMRSPYPDRFSVNSETVSFPSSKDYILDSPEDQLGTDNYKLRCLLFKYCVNSIENTIHTEIKHTTDKCVYLIKQYLACTSKNYCNSRVLPICLVLLDSQTYKHEKQDVFGLESYCTNVLHHNYMEMNELSGSDLIREEMEKNGGDDSDKQLDIYLYQSEFHKLSNIKEIVEYCLSCRINHGKKINLLVEWNCFPEEFGNLLQRSNTANCIIQSILFPSSLQLLNNVFSKIIINHTIPISFPPSFLIMINSTLINYDFSIWSWCKAIEFYTWHYFSYQPASVICLEIIKSRLPPEPRAINTVRELVKKSEKRGSTVEPRYDFRKKRKLESRFEEVKKEELLTNFDGVKCLTGQAIPILSENKNIHHFSKTKIHSCLHSLLSYWSIQAQFIEVFSTILTMCSFSYSKREIYCQIIGKKENQPIDVLQRFHTFLKTIQDLPLFESFLQEFHQFIDTSVMPLKRCYSILKGQIDHCQEEYEKSKQEQPSSIQSRIDVLKKIQNRDELKRQLEKQQDEQSRIKQHVKELFFSFLKSCITCIFEDKEYLELNSLFLDPHPPSRSTLNLLNRKTVINGILYPSIYYQCQCCKKNEITENSDDFTILYQLIISLGKGIEVNELRRQFYAYFKHEKKDILEARFWDCLTTFQYLGFLEISANEEKIIKLDFAI